MKRLLILGGAAQHCKLVETAKQSGIYTIVTDCFTKSPAKQISDKSYDIDIFNVSEILELCKKESINSILASHLDPCQKPYVEICNRMGFPCYATKEQINTLTNKVNFKKFCHRVGIPVIEEYSYYDVIENKLEYPVFVKPSDSRGSRGTCKCATPEETLLAIDNAKLESSDRQVIIEKCYSNLEEIQVVYYYIKGIPYLIRTSDSYPGMILDNLTSCSISPSRYTELYINKAHPRIINALKKLKITEGPVFFQCFCDGEDFYFFDPARRFPGTDFELMIKKATGIDFIELMIEFSQSGDTKVSYPTNDIWKLNGKVAAILFPTLAPGKIGNISINKNEFPHNNVISYWQRVKKGDIISDVSDINRRLGEIDILANNMDELCCLINKVQKSVSVEDVNGRNMILESFEVTQVVN